MELINERAGLSLLAHQLDWSKSSVKAFTDKLNLAITSANEMTPAVPRLA